MGGLQYPGLYGAAPGGLYVDLMLRRDLFGVGPITPGVDHPAPGPVLFPHTSGDHILVFAGVNDGQGHPVGFAIGAVHFGKPKMGVHRVGAALAGQGPF